MSVVVVLGASEDAVRLLQTARETSDVCIVLEICLVRLHKIHTRLPIQGPSETNVSRLLERRVVCAIFLRYGVATRPVAGLLGTGTSQFDDLSARRPHGMLPIVALRISHASRDLVEKIRGRNGTVEGGQQVRRQRVESPLQETNLVRLPVWLDFARGVEVGAVPAVRAVSVRVCRKQRQWLGASGGRMGRGSGTGDEGTHVARARRKRKRRERRSGGGRPTVHNCPRG